MLFFYFDKKNQNETLVLELRPDIKFVKNLKIGCRFYTQEQMADACVNSRC
jgi:hypothetical protein